MKKLIALALILASVFALCACGSSFPALSGSAKTDADPEPVETPSATASLNYVTVDITKDNFYDYFEFVEFPSYDIAVTESPDGLAQKVYAMSGFYLKDKYSIQVIRENNCSVRIGVKFDTLCFDQNRNITIDMNSLTYEVTGDPSNVYSYDGTIEGTTFIDGNSQLSYMLRLPTRFTYGTGLADDFSFITDNIEIVSVTGKLYLIETEY